ncbi:MAG: CsbD family protein [Pirellulaceae bacterium]|nr:CsbD family protein [Pirellulaceae bacterium]
MNWDRIEGKWKQVKGQVQQRWGDLTNDDLDKIDGKREELVGQVQERYGLAKDEAERQVDDFAGSCDC